MKKPTVMPASGVQIENTLSMALHSRGRKRMRLELVALAMLGMVSVLFTFLTMFTPMCNIGVVIGFSLALLLFICFHSGSPDITHYSLLVMLLAYAVFFYWKREEIAAGMMYLMNDIYRAIYMTDWDYFTTDPTFEPIRSTTMALCFALVPITWLLGYAVVRFRNLFLCMLVTFPFVEIGFFFGIAPEHLPAAGLIAFWCGMAAVQLASGTSARRQNARSGFVRRGNAFLPIAKLRFLLTEHSGLCTALAVFLLCLAGEYGMQLFHYERPEKVKEMRTDFQYYAASIDWSDWNTIFPFLQDKDTEEPQEYIELGRSDKREFENSVVSEISLTQRPIGRTYLKFSTYQTYDKSRWKTLAEDAYRDPAMTMFGQVDYYPSEFLYYSAQTLGYETADLTLLHPNSTLSRCVPYGFEKSRNIAQSGDMIARTSDTTYHVFTGDNYENLLLGTISYDIPAYTQLEISPEQDREALTSLLRGHEEQVVQFPQSITAGSVYFGDENGLARRAEAAVLSASGYTDFAYETYTQLPDTDEIQHVGTLFADLFSDFDARSATPAETMILLERLRERLCASVTYTLSPGKTPPGEDYVAYFLLENQKGYCTHYATAGTLLARMAGIPARYCEGYLVDATTLHRSEHDGAITFDTAILDSNAHAWTEIFIDGFGWIPFEFTFSYFTPPELPTEPETEPATEAVSEDPTEIPVMTQPVTTVVPVPAQPATSASEDAEPTEEPFDWGLFMAIVCPCAVVIGIVLTFLLARKNALSRRELALADPIGDTAAKYAWHLLLECMEYCRVNVHAGSSDTLMQEVLAKCSDLLSEKEIRCIVRTGTKLRYSPRGLKEPERDLLIAAYRKFIKNLYAASNPFEKFYLKWIRHYL